MTGGAIGASSIWAARADAGRSGWSSSNARISSYGKFESMGGSCQSVKRSLGMLAKHQLLSPLSVGTDVSAASQATRSLKPSSPGTAADARFAGGPGEGERASEGAGRSCFLRCAVKTSCRAKPRPHSGQVRTRAGSWFAVWRLRWSVVSGNVSYALQAARREHTVEAVGRKETKR